MSSAFTDDFQTLLANNPDYQSHSFVNQHKPSPQLTYNPPQSILTFNTQSKSVKMKFSAAAVIAAAAGASAWKGNVTYTTEVVTAVTTYCPAATEVTYGGTTYTITEATTLTITDCPCTITRPVTTTSYSNSTAAAPTKSVGTVSVSPSKTASTVPTAGAGKAALSGGALAGVLGLAALVL
jgi:hypothetical protein